MLKTKIVNALAQRKLRHQPAIMTPVLVTLVGVFAFLVLAYIVPGQDVPYQQFKEGWAVNAFSTFFLGAGSALAFFCFVGRSEQKELGRWFWLLLGMGFLFLCLDEQLEFHERGGYFILYNLGIDPLPGFRNWNDIIVICYGLVAGTICLVFIVEMLRFRRFIELLMVGAFFYVLHSAIDSLFEGQFKMVPEESAKLLANAFFALAFLASALGVSAEMRSSPGTTSSE